MGMIVGFEGTGVLLDDDFLFGETRLRCAGGGEGDSARNFVDGTRCRFVLRSSVAGVGGASAARLLAEGTGVSGEALGEAFAALGEHLLGVAAMSQT